MGDKLTVDEINIKLQEAIARDREGFCCVVKAPVPFTELEPDDEGWEEFVERVLEEDPPPEEAMEE